MDDDSPEPHPLATWSIRAVRFLVCLILLAVIAGAVYATCLPSLFYQHQTAEKPAGHRGPNP